MSVDVWIDVSGLSWRYRTGVQSLYWAFVESAAAARLPDGLRLAYYDRSPGFNRAIRTAVGRRYRPLVPRWWPSRPTRPWRMLDRFLGLNRRRIAGGINHVWNWDLFHDPGARGSITIPDLLPLEYPQWFDPGFRNATTAALEFARHRAEFVFCISHDVRDRVVAAGVDRQRTHVVYPGVDAIYRDPVPAALEDEVLARHGLRRRRFLLSSGFLDPRKNLARQIEAFAIHARREGDDLSYVLTGLKNDQSGEVLAAIGRLGLRERVILLGYVPAEELRILMGTAAAVMYCSLAEGFGLPIVEAMAAGSPVITASTTSMREIGTGRADLADPQDVEAIAAAIAAAMRRPEAESQARIAANRRFAADFTPERWVEGHAQAWAGRA